MSDRVVVVTKRSAYGRYVEDENDPLVRSLLRKRDPAVARWRAAHREHVRTLDAVLAALDKLGVRTTLVRRPHAAFDPTDAMLVVTVGGDGTLLAASHNVADTPVLGINSSPSHSVGYFCAAHRKNARSMLRGALAGSVAPLELARMRVRVNGRIRARRVLNEALYCAASPAATSRYIVRYGGLEEEHRSSGFWIGPAAGSTAAQLAAGGKLLPLSSRKLQLVVREPYIRRGQKFHLLKVVVEDGEKVVVHSKMRDAAMFLDGPYKQIRVRLGDTATFDVSDVPLRVLGLKGTKRGAARRP